MTKPDEAEDTDAKSKADVETALEAETRRIPLVTSKTTNVVLMGILIRYSVPNKQVRRAHFG